MTRDMYDALCQLRECVDFIQAHFVLDIRVPELPPYGPHGEPSAGFPPVPRAAVGATLSEPERCSCEESLELRERIRKALRLIHTSTDIGSDLAHELGGILDGEA